MDLPEAMILLVLLRLYWMATRMENQMGLVTSAHSMSLDGFIADAAHIAAIDSRLGCNLETPQAA
jgi:hypothetical protein